MLYYVSNSEFPGKEAHTIQQMRMCEAFQRAGVNVRLLHPSHGRSNDGVQWKDVADYYGLETEFEVQTLPSFQDRVNLLPQVGMLSMAGPMASYLALKTLTGAIGCSDVIYGRNYYPLLFFCEFRKLLPDNRHPPVVFEHHDMFSTWWRERFFDSIDGLVSITRTLEEATQKTYDISSEQCLVAPDGVDLAPYETISQEEARMRLSIEPDERIVMYTGQLYPSKGVDVLARAATDIDATVYIVGGFEDDIERVRRAGKDADNLIFTGFVEPSDIPTFQVAADILVAPYTTEARDYLSPLKLFEYMAAGRPIIASDLVVLREVLSEGENAALVPPEDAGALASTVNSVLQDGERYDTLAQGARADVGLYTWDQRAKRILSFLAG